MTPRDDIPADVQALCVCVYDDMANRNESLSIYQLMGRAVVADRTTRAPEPAAGVEEVAFSIQERDDDMLIAERDWQFGWRCIARRPKLTSNEEWRPVAERIVLALAHAPDEERIRHKAADEERDQALRNLAAMVRQLRRWAPEEWVGKSTRLLERYGLQGSPFRARAEQDKAGGRGE